MTPFVSFPDVLSDSPRFRARLSFAAKVVRTALEDASSVAGLLITTEAMVADKPAKEGAGAPAMPDMGGMGGMM